MTPHPALLTPHFTHLLQFACSGSTRFMRCTEFLQNKSFIVPTFNLSRVVLRKVRLNRHLKSQIGLALFFDALYCWPTTLHLRIVSNASCKQICCVLQSHSTCSIIHFCSSWKRLSDTSIKWRENGDCSQHKVASKPTPAYICAATPASWRLSQFHNPSCLYLCS